MAKSSIYVGLEIGTSKICMVVGEVKGDGAIKILGVGEAPSRGVRKGEVVDFETAQGCVHDALTRAEERSDVMIGSVYLAVTGGYVESFNNRGAIDIPEEDNEIGADALKEVKDSASDVSLEQDHAFIHRIIQHYYVDGQDKVVNPVGMFGKRLEADYHIIHGIRNRVHNTIRCVRELPLEVDDVVFSPIAAAQIILSPEQKSAGALMIDVGGGTTDYVLYEDGVVVDSGCFAVGGDHITNDISIVLKIPLSRAEKLKVKEGSAVAGTGAEKLHLEGDKKNVAREIDRDKLNAIIHARTREIFELIGKATNMEERTQRMGGGVFLTGGASLLDGIESVAEEVLRVPVRCTRSKSTSGLTATFENPKYSTAIGLLRYAQIVDRERPRKGVVTKVGEKLKDLLGVGSRLFS